MSTEVYARAYTSLQYRLRTLMGGRFANHCRPSSICLLLTERCNARCVHCDIWKNTGREDSPTREQWMQTLSELRSWLGPVYVVFTGGEALIRPFAADLVAHASNLGLLPEVLTHGYWEDQGKIEKLCAANPWKITVSVDGIGDTHTQIRGRVKFWERTARSIETMRRLRSERNFGYTIRLKHVLMSHNVGEAVKVAEYANHPGMELFVQPIEQNYNTPDDSQWFLHSENWPSDTAAAVASVEDLIERKRRGWRIANSEAQLRAMIAYFRDPDSHRVAAQMHAAHEKQRVCSALTMLQVQANGDVTVCTGVPVVGNIRTDSIASIWSNRPQLWKSGCCFTRRCSEAEKQGLVAIAG